MKKGLIHLVFISLLIVCNTSWSQSEEIYLSELLAQKLQLENKLQQCKTTGDFKMAYRICEQLKTIEDSLYVIKENESILKNKYDLLAEESKLLQVEMKKNEAILEMENEYFEKQKQLFMARILGLIIIIISIISIIWVWIKIQLQKNKLKKINRFLLKKSGWLKQSPVVLFEFTIDDSLILHYVSDNIRKYHDSLQDNLMNASQFFQQLDRADSFLEQVKKKLQAGENRFNLSAQLTTADGSKKYFDFYIVLSSGDSNTAFRVHAFLLDNTKLATTNEKLQEVNQLIMDTNYMAGMGGWSYKLENKEMFWTDYIYHLHGLDKEFKPNPRVNLQYYNGPLHQQRVKKYWIDAIQKGTPFDDEFEIINTTGEVKMMRVVAKPIFEKQVLIRIDGIIQDISERKKKEEQLRKTYLLAAKQNKQLQSFAYIVSHNLRSNVANFESIVNLLKEENEPEQKQKLIDSLVTSSDRLKETLFNLNEVILVQNNATDKFKNIDVCQELEKIAGGLTYLFLDAGAEIRFHFHCHPVISYIPAYFESIFQNLMTNAIKYRSPNRPCRIDIDVQELEDFVKVAVRDNGLGIDLNQYGAQLFGMYKTFHKNEDARGIGLFLVKNQIETMGGRIEVHSTPDEGTEFSVYLSIKNEEINYYLN
ncbi:MAG: sensor histidine kinase [Flavobacteriales bacterium]